MANFWDNLPRPFFALAPMLDVSDTAFRQLIASFAKPDILFTEFVSVDGLLHERSQEKMIRYYFPYEEEERPIVAQIWGNDPEKFKKAAEVVCRLGFDGIDINMGCPDKKVISCGGGAGLIQDFSLAQQIIQATKEGATYKGKEIPVSVKTRLGFDTDASPKWIEAIAEVQPVAIAIHARTKKEMSKVPAHWEKLPQLVEILHKKRILCVGNGDVRDLKEAHEKASMYGVDGVMIGRGIFGKPWFFEHNQHEKTKEERIQTLKKHINLFEKYFIGIKSFSMLKKHFKGYINGWDGAKEFRSHLMNCKTVEDARKIIQEYENNQKVF